MRKRSKLLHGSDEPRAEIRAQGEPGSATDAPGEAPPDRAGAAPKAGDGPQRAGFRRRRQKPADSGPRQGGLFDELEEHGAAPSRHPAAQRPDRPPEGQDASPSDSAPKSRSKRRRERRKAARAEQQQGQPKVAGTVAPPTGPRGRPPSDGNRQRGQQREDQRGSPKPDSGREVGRHRSDAERSARGRPSGEKHRVRAEDPARRDSSRKGKRGDQRGRQAQPGRGSPRPEGLPPLTEEDIGALNRLGEEGLPSYFSGRGQLSASHKPLAAVRPLETLAPSTESLAAIETLSGVIEEGFPLPAKHRAELKGDIRKLWEELTSDRESRSLDYLSVPSALSAYLRYFLPWNMFRLSAILSNADFCLADNSVVVDIGSGPLTVVLALWAARPELREVPLTIYCLDRVERVLEAGRSIFETLCLRMGGRIPPWRIETRREPFGSGIGERAHLLTAANVFNEFFWRDHRNLGERAIETARTLLSYLRENGSLFVMEPGDPRSGAFISSLRAALIAEGAQPLGPCPHSLACPMPGIFRHLLPPEETRTAANDPNIAPSRFVLPSVAMPKKRDKYPWCHFGVDTAKAPSWLHALSEEAGLPKEKASLSYLWAARGALTRSPLGIPELAPTTEKERRARAGKGLLVRVVSEPFALSDGGSGQYACSSLGYTLLKRKRGDEPLDSGNLLEVVTSPLARNDAKSGAIVLPT